MSRPPSWTDWLPTLAFTGFGTVCILSGPAAAVQHGVAAGLGFAIAGLGSLCVALWLLGRLVIVRGQQVAELRRQEAESGVGVPDEEGTP